MSKSLVESAADILNTSLKGAGKDPMVAGPGSGAQEVGGETPDSSDLENRGARAAAPVKQNPPPSTKGDPKSVKVQAMEEVEVDEDVELTEEELDDYINSLTEEELAELVAEAEELDESEQLDELSPGTYRSAANKLDRQAEFLSNLGKGALARQVVGRAGSLRGAAKRREGDKQINNLGRNTPGFSPAAQRRLGITSDDKPVFTTRDGRRVGGVREEIEAYLDTLSEEELAELVAEAQSLPPMHHVTNQAGQVVGTHSYDQGFKPNKIGSSLGLEPHPTRIPNKHTIDRSRNIRKEEIEQIEAEELEELDEQGMTGVTTGAPGKAATVKTKHQKGSTVPNPKMAEETELSAEEIAEARTAAIKEMVAKNMSSCKEDVDALFNGEALSEEFRNKATTIFEAAVRARVEAITTQVVEENEQILADAVAEINEDLTAQVDEYLNYVVENWMEENELAIETGIRAEIAEDFMAGLKNLFAEHYIEVPEEKADLVDAIAEEAAIAEAALEEAKAEIANITKALNESKATEILRKTCEGLTEMQVAKIKALAEGVEFTTEGEYADKLAVIRESYFPSGKPVRAAAPQVVVETEEAKGTNNVMDFYVNAITKQLPK